MDLHNQYLRVPALVLSQDVVGHIFQTASDFLTIINEATSAKREVSGLRGERRE